MHLNLSYEQTERPSKRPPELQMERLSRNTIQKHRRTQLNRRSRPSMKPQLEQEARKPLAQMKGIFTGTCDGYAAKARATQGYLGAAFLANGG